MQSYDFFFNLANNVVFLSLCEMGPNLLVSASVITVLLCFSFVLKLDFTASGVVAEMLAWLGWVGVPLNSEVGVGGYFFQKRVLLICIIHLAAIVCDTVADNQIIDSHHHIVAANLVEHALGDTHRRTFVFDYHAWKDMEVVKHRVASALHAVHREAHFIGHQVSGIASVVDKIVYERLSHHLLGGGCHIFFPERVEKLLFRSVHAEKGGEGGKI